MEIPPLFVLPDVSVSGGGPSGFAGGQIFC